MRRFPRFTLVQLFLLVALFGMFWGVIAELNRRWRLLYFDASVAIAPDSNTIATGISSLPVILWDAPTSKRVAALHGHSSYVSGVAFSPDGTLLASCGTDDTVRLWDIASHREILKIDAGQTRR